LHHHYIEAAWRQLRHATQITACREHNALAFRGADTGQRPAMVDASAATDFDKHHGALSVAHNQVYFATAAPRCAVIALQQLQTLGLQKCQGLVFSVIASAFAGSRLG
jgi:hypothetical protein